MPLLYGEGSKSFLRLQEEIVKNHDDLSLFAWKQDTASYGIGLLRGCFANSPAEFAHWPNIQMELKKFESGMEVTSKNVRMDGRVLREEDHRVDIGHGVDCIFDLGVTDPDNEDNSLGILLAGSSRNITHFRFKPYELIKLPPSKALLSKDEYYDDYQSHNNYWEEKQAREELERESISIRKSITVQETRMMGHHQKPVFKIHWNKEVLKVLKSVNGQNTKEYIPSFECHPSSASHEDGTLIWVTDFELQIYPQHRVSFVLVTGLHLESHDYRPASGFGQAKLPRQVFWTFLLGEGRAYVTSEREDWDDQSTAIEILDEIDEDNSQIVRQIKQMGRRERGIFVRENSFRLLHLEPSLDHRADLKDSLQHARLSDCDYDLIEPCTALSYVWGDASHKGVIHLSGRAKGITANLYAALRDMRNKSRVLRIWANDLCIDQSNNYEKCRQVTLMGRIYSIAHHTVVHLGKSPPGFAKLFIDLKAQSQTAMHGNTPALGQLSLTDDEIDGMRRDLLSKPWFRRVWVFQELVLSTDVWVQCDDLRIRWHHFCNVVDMKNVVAALLLDTFSDSIAQQRQPQSATPLEVMNIRRYGAFEAPLSTLLSCRRGIGATDPRDIVFGHLGVVSDRDRCDRFIKVDYGRDFEHVSIDAAQYFFDATGIEGLLSHAMNPSPITAPGYSVLVSSLV
ncbi:uncharacterized protein FFB14_06007 [Fusarium fujikuroi]|nr:uncharacterized protein FFB14_06007 [Fusarium fujikuroi]